MDKLIQLYDPDGNEFSLISISPVFNSGILQLEFNDYWEKEKDSENVEDFLEWMNEEYTGYEFTRVYIGETVTALQ